MTEELQNKLYAKYPKIFADKDKSMQESCMFWGIECGDGWFTLLDRLCSSIQFRVDNPPHTKDGPIPIPQVVAEQIKEKFGGLRFYYRGGNENIDGKISFAESLSYHICEVCGSMKNVGQTSGWIITLCKECAERDNIINWEEYDD